MSIVEIFSTASDKYAAYRPRYPDALFSHLAGMCSERSVVWDCGTGSGQATASLARWFDRVVATDASFTQVSQGARGATIDFAVCTAEQPALARGVANLITVAQALHWLRLDDFYTAARWVAAPGAVIAAWTYNLATITPELDQVIRYLYSDVLGAFWAQDRRLVEEGYSFVPWPFDEQPFPNVPMAATWTFEQLLGYLRTWSAAHSYLKARGHDAIAECEPALRDAWGREANREITFPLMGRIGRIE